MTIPGHLIDEYWADVINELIKASSVSTEDAAKQVELFRSQLASVDVDELVYHREARDVAKSIQMRQRR